MNKELFILINGYSLTKPNPTPQEYLNKMEYLFDKYALNYEEINEEKKTILCQIIENKNIIDNKLSPIKELGIDFEFSVVGGALRDLIINKENEINDFDFVLKNKCEDTDQLIKACKTLNINIDNRELKHIIEFRKDKKVNQIKEMYKSWGQEITSDDKYITSEEKRILEEVTREYYFSLIVENLTKDLPETNYFKSNYVDKEYMNFHISGIRQFKLSNNKKVDLIISDFGNIEFLSTFDFEICKVFANLNDITNEKDLLEKMVPTGSMLRDLEDKTISLNPIKFNVEHIEYFFSKHYLKLKEKLQDHELNLFSIKKKEQFTENDKLLWGLADSKRLEMKLAPKEKVKNLKI